MASPASPDSARAYYTESIDLENQSVPFTKTDPKAKNRCRADRRAPPSKTPREATAPPSQNKKAKFELFLLLLVLLLSLFADDCHQKRTGTSWIGFSGVTRAPNGRMHFCADWRSSGQQLNENRTPSAFSKSDHDIADAMWVSTTAVSFFLEEREGRCSGAREGVFVTEKNNGEEIPPSIFVCVVSKRQFFICICAHSK